MKKTGIELIAEERREQIEKHGRTVQHDKEVNCFNQLPDAAIMLLGGIVHEDEENACPFKWDTELWYKMMAKPYIERLVIVGALVAAEIDRRQLNDEVQKELLCDCQDPENGLVSMSCPIHNTFPLKEQ